MSSKNYPTIKSLSSAVSRGLTPGQESDLVNKISEDLNTVYSAVFTGPLPVNDGHNLTNLSRESLPEHIAWTDLVNTFTEDQIIQHDPAGAGKFTIIGDQSEFRLEGNYAKFVSYFSSTATKPSRFQNIADGKTLIGSGVYYDGTYHDDGGNNSGIILNDTYAFSVIKYLAGVLTHTLRVESGGQTTVGALTTLTDLLVNELGLKNGKFIRGTNNAGTHNLPMMVMDADDLVQLGSNPSGATTGEGNVAISTVPTADIPVAGGNRNGIIIINDTTNQLCYYASGNRYRIAGVAF